MMFKITYDLVAISTDPLMPSDSTENQEIPPSHIKAHIHCKRLIPNPIFI